MGRDYAEERKDMIAINVERAENFEESEMNRTLANLLRSQHRREQSVATRKKYLIEFRDSALKFLKRNQLMRERSELVEHLKDEEKKQHKKFKFYCTMVVIQKYVTNYLWKRFD